MDIVHSEVRNRHQVRIEQVIVNGHGVDFCYLIVEKTIASDQPLFLSCPERRAERRDHLMHRRFHAALRIGIAGETNVNLELVETKQFCPAHVHNEE